MHISYDPKKREVTLAERGLDFDDVAEVFAGRRVIFVDLRRDYGEVRQITIGYLSGRMVIVVWTLRGNVHHIISMRKANEKEQKRYQRTMD